jgi:large subunit ribosomal protein L6
MSDGIGPSVGAAVQQRGKDLEVFAVSRIGKLPVQIPSGVKVSVEGDRVSVSGPKGTLERVFHPDMTIKLVDGQISVARPSDEKQHKALHGLTRTLINNMLIGVSQGYTKELDVVGVGYRASLRGANLALQLGHSHGVEVVPPPGIKFEVTAGSRGDREVVASISVSGPDKELVGQVAASIRAWRPPEPYKGKGVRYRDEHVRRKAGKAGKVG